jgi:hypothetical protein
MKFKYLGGESLPGSGVTVVFGDYKVSVGGTVELPTSLASKARNHPHFEAIEDAVKVVEAPAPVVAVTEPSRDELIAEAEKHGVAIDRRWSNTRIIDAMQAKLTALKGA